MNNSDIELKRDVLVDHLKKHEMKIQFTKVDGTTRNMLCTLNSEKMPEAPIVEGRKRPQKSTSTISVWDLEANGWRSFRVDSVIKTRILK